MRTSLPPLSNHWRTGESPLLIRSVKRGDSLLTIESPPVFREASNPSSFFGANLIGAMIGGFCEYLSMKIGNGNLMFLVIGAYVLSLAFRKRLALLQ
jgi:hypothetical protein